METMMFGYGAGAAVAGLALAKLWVRLRLSRAKHPSLRGHSKLSQRLARLVPACSYDEEQFFRSDGAPEEVVKLRRAGFSRLGRLYAERFEKTLDMTRRAHPAVSDMQFTSNYRVPFQYAALVKKTLPVGSFLQASDGAELIDLDGNRFYDLTGSYGVNVLGYDAYKGCLERAMARVHALGPVLGHYHPVMVECVERLRRISKQDEVSFHMSGTEAVMQAVRLARYHTRRTHLVRFCGAYHGWWGDVQPGVGNPIPAHETYTLKDMDEDTLRVLRTRRDIACVLVNPLQALHPNENAPSDSTLVDSGRKAQFDRAAYTDWLRRLREVCTERGIVLIFDEVFVGFRLAQGGAQEYFGIRADLVTYGKTLGGGLPVGVVCGRHDLMRRFRPERPTDVCFARGTFNSHPYVMAAMLEFLELSETREVKALYEDQDRVWDERAMALNRRLQQAQLPIRVANLQSIWTVCYTEPARYNWMFQYYLRAEGLLPSWVGTGRFIFSLNLSADDFSAICDRFVAAAQNMKADGFLWSAGETNKAIRRQVLLELLAARFAKKPPKALPESEAARSASLAR
jgi:glutamate-1-semialdehyde 2,1-aminomutase